MKSKGLRERIKQAETWADAEQLHREAYKLSEKAQRRCKKALNARKDRPS